MLVSGVSDDQAVTLLLYGETNEDNTTGLLFVCAGITDDEGETFVEYAELTGVVRTVVLEDPFTVVI